jgi:dipeptidase E
MNRKLLLYSDQIPPLTDAIDEHLLRWLPARGAVIGYIPAGPDPNRDWFRARNTYYARYGFELRSFGLEDEYDESKQEELMSCDAIHLSGGNTFQFLYWLKARNKIAPLQQYVHKGGVLIGVSAGALLMTPSVGPSLICGDVPYEGIKDGEGLSLVDFAILPHFDGSQHYVQGLTSFSKGFHGSVYAISDGGGIVVEGSSVTCVGEVRQMSAGRFQDS